MHDVYTTSRWKATFTGAVLCALHVHVQVLVDTALSGLRANSAYASAI